MNFIEIVKDRVRHHLVLQSISDLLERVGVSLIPYYVFEEFITDKLGLNLESVLKPVAAAFLSHSEIEQLCLQPDSGELVLEKEKLLTDSCQCFALKHNEEVVSYMLCNLRQCDSRLLFFPLKEDEVYLSGMFTVAAHRGKNLAAVLENELYKQLYVMGRKKYYSLNILFNTPGLVFKKKLQSKPANLCLYVRFFNRFQRNITLRRYQK